MAKKLFVYFHIIQQSEDLLRLWCGLPIFIGLALDKNILYSFKFQKSFFLIILISELQALLREALLLKLVDIAFDYIFGINGQQSTYVQRIWME